MFKIHFQYSTFKLLMCVTNAVDPHGVC